MATFVRITPHVILFFVLSACHSNPEKIVEGDLYFKLLDMDMLFDADSTTLSSIENRVHIIDTNSLSGAERELYDAFKFMADNKLLRKPYIRLRSDNGDIRILLLDSTDYNKFTSYRWSDLSKKKQKIRVKAIATEFNYPLHWMNTTEPAYNALKVLSIEQMDGETYWTK